MSFYIKRIIETHEYLINGMKLNFVILCVIEFNILIRKLRTVDIILLQ